MYNNNEIKQVIFRLDFADKTVSNEIVDNPLFLEAVLNTFKTQKPDEVQRVNELAQNPSDPSLFKANQLNKITKVFSTIDGSVNLRFNNQFLIISASVYMNRVQFSEFILPVLEKFFEEEQSCLVSRIGLRFINIFDASKYNTTDFATKYKALITNNKNINDSLIYSQSIIHEEVISEDIRIKLNFGLYNPTMPSPLKNKDILVDIDAIHGGAVKTFEDVSRIFERAQSISEIVFESVITDTLRKKLDK